MPVAQSAAAESIISTRVLQRRSDKVPVVTTTCQPTDATAHEFSHTRRGVFTFPGSRMRRCTHACGVVRSRARRDRERDLLVSASAVREHMSRVVWLVPMKSWSLTPSLACPAISPGYQPPSGNAGLHVYNAPRRPKVKVNIGDTNSDRAFGNN